MLSVTQRIRTFAHSFKPTPLRFSRPAISRSVKMAAEKLDKSTPDSKWKELLNAEEYYVLRNKGTEPPRSGKYDKMYPADGEFQCAACGTALYPAGTKFDSGCGWPAFWDNIPDTVERHPDFSGGMKRVEITCANCGGHLGHVFEGERFGNPKDERHCVNSISIKYVPKQ